MTVLVTVCTVHVFCVVAIDCGHPPNPNPRSSVEVDDTTLGSTATYTCDHGYVSVGPVTVECLYTKKWSDVAPVCERKLLYRILWYSLSYSL